MSAQRNHFARNVVTVAASFAVAALMGLVRDMVLARQFGMGAELDVYYAGFKLPELLFTLVAGGALATALVPLLMSALADEGHAALWRLASAVANIVLTVALALAALTALLAPWLVRTFVAPGFDALRQAETVAVMRLALLSTLIFALSSIVTSVLHSHKHFTLPALAPILYPVGLIAGALWLTPIWGVRGLAVGAILGSLLHLGIQMPALLRLHARWQPVYDLGKAAVRRVFVLMGPRILDLGVFQLTMLATASLASRLGAGSVSSLEWGWQLMQFPETIIGTAFGLVALPTLSDLAARRDVPGLRSTLGSSLRVIIALTVPAACGLVLLGRPLVAVLYQRGAFGAAATEAVYAALRFYALGLVGHACLEVAARAFFAQQDTLTPLYLATGSALLNVGLGVLLMGPLGHGGLALANSLAVTLEVSALLLILRRRWGRVGGARTAAALVRVLAASGVMVVAILATQRLLTDERGALWQLVVGALVGIATYAGSGLLLGLRGALRAPTR